MMLRVGMLLAAVALLALATGVSANPLPPAMLFFHVHPWDEDFCIENPIDTCEQIVQYTQESGGLEFDLYLIAMDPYIQDAMFDIEWSPWWGEPLVFESCVGGSCQSHPTGSGIHVEWTFDPPLDIDPGAPLLLGRVGLMAYDFGEMTLAYGSMTGDFWTEVVGATAQACVGECYCYTDCETMNTACGADFDDPILLLEAPQGEIAEGVIGARIRWGGDYMPCPVTFVTDEECCTLSEEYFQGGMRAEVTVSVDTHELPVGEYAFTIRAESACVACARVIVDVLEPSDVPEEPALRRSWGRVKSDFR